MLAVGKAIGSFAFVTALVLVGLPTSVADGGALTVVVTTDQSSYDPASALANGVHVSGTVSNADGSPAAGAFVRVSITLRTSATTWVVAQSGDIVAGADGSFAYEVPTQGEIVGTYDVAALGTLFSAQGVGRATYAIGA